MGFNFEKQPGLIRHNAEISVEQPLLSIITPFYNAGVYFEQTFFSVMNQTFIWFEWIIVDDGSTEKRDLELLEQLTRSDKRVQIFHIENGGPARARNFAVEKAKTEIIVSLDADDLIEPTYLEQTFFALYFHPDAAWAYTDSLGIGEWQYVWKVPFDSEKLKRENFLIEVGTFRKQFFKAVGGYDDAQKFSHEDWTLWLQFLAAGGYPVHIASLSAWYRIKKNGALHKTNDDEKAKKRAFERISLIASQIKAPVRAIEYPRLCSKKEWQPRPSTWEYKKNKDKTEILVCLPELENSKTGRYVLKLLKGTDLTKYHFGIAVMSGWNNTLKQTFADYSDDILEMPAFLDFENYAEFLCYYIKSRQTDIVWLCGDSYAGILLPWLKKQFPELAVVESFASHKAQRRRGAKEELLIDGKELKIREHNKALLKEMKKYTGWCGPIKKKIRAYNIRKGRL